jgi:hypothetical protein
LLDARLLPAWYTDAKLGVFVHWGLYSIPAFAEAGQTDGDYPGFMAELTAGKDTKGRIPYAEWYLNALRVPGRRPGGTTAPPTAETFPTSTSGPGSTRPPSRPWGLSTRATPPRNGPS